MRVLTCNIHCDTGLPFIMGLEIFYNFGIPFLGHRYYILSLFDLCLGVKKKMFKEILHFHYMTYMATPKHTNPCLGGHENFGRPFLSHRYYTLSLSNLCLGVKNNIFKGIMHFHYITYMYMVMAKPNNSSISFETKEIKTETILLHQK